MKQFITGRSQDRNDVNGVVAFTSDGCVPKDRK